MALNLTNFVRQISKEKDLEPEVIKEAIEQALIVASKKNLSMYKNARAELDLESGHLDLLVTKEVVKKVTNRRQQIDQRSAKKIRSDVEIGEEIEVPVPPAEFGRIAAQSAKQVVIQRLRDAEREKIYEEYKDRVGQVVTGIVQRFERRDAVVNIGRADGILTLNQQPYGSHYRVGDRIKVLVIEIEKTARGPVIRLSRTDPELVIRLFEQEVPEVADGTVKIVAIAREAGVRTKVGVMSTNPDVDPVGACVGMKGSRVQMIVREFENEKIDIVPYSSNDPTFITNALNPAKILSVKCDEETGEADVLVARGNLSLAIGKRGQNARLAARLTGWKINVRGEEETEAEAEAEEMRGRYLDDLLNQIPELNEKQRATLAASDLNSVEKLAEADLVAITRLIGCTDELAAQIAVGAEEYLEGLAEMAEEGSEEGEEGEEAGEEAEEPEVAESPEEAESPDEETTEEGEEETVEDSETDSETETEAEADVTGEEGPEPEAEAAEKEDEEPEPEPVDSPEPDEDNAPEEPGEIESDDETDKSPEKE